MNDLRPADRLWVAILEREPEFWNLSDHEARERLYAGEFPEPIIAAFLRRRAAKNEPVNTHWEDAIQCPNCAHWWVPCDADNADMQALVAKLNKSSERVPNSVTVPRDYYEALRADYERMCSLLVKANEALAGIEPYVAAKYGMPEAAVEAVHKAVQRATNWEIP